jgi:hypothetical protein
VVTAMTRSPTVMVPGAVMPVMVVLVARAVPVVVGVRVWWPAPMPPVAVVLAAGTPGWPVTVPRVRPVRMAPHSPRMGLMGRPVGLVAPGVSAVPAVRPGLGPGDRPTVSAVMAVTARPAVTVVPVARAASAMTRPVMVMPVVRAAPAVMAASAVTAAPLERGRFRVSVVSAGMAVMPDPGRPAVMAVSVARPPRPVAPAVSAVLPVWPGSGAAGPVPEQRVLRVMAARVAPAARAGTPPRPGWLAVTAGPVVSVVRPPSDWPGPAVPAAPPAAA